MNEFEHYTTENKANISVEIDEEALKEYQELVYKLGYDYPER